MMKYKVFYYLLACILIFNSLQLNSMEMAHFSCEEKESKQCEHKDGPDAIDADEIDIGITDVVTVFIIQGPWEDADYFDPDGAFYEQLVFEVNKHNSINPHKTIRVMTHRCPRAWTSIYDQGKITQAQSLAVKILKERHAGRRVHVFAHAGAEKDLGGGTDVLAITTQILNTQLQFECTKASRGESHTEERSLAQFQRVLSQAQKSLIPGKSETQFANRTINPIIFELENKHRAITAHFVGTLYDSSFSRLINFDDDAIVKAVHTYNYELTLYEKIRACCACCYGKTKKILTSRHLQKIASIAVDVAITAAIAAI